MSSGSRGVTTIWPVHNYTSLSTPSFSENSTWVGRLQGND